MAWSDREFLQRVARRCEEIGKSQRTVLKEAGIAHDYLQTTPTHGRRIDIIEKLCKPLDWSLSDVLGLAGERPTDPEMLDQAYIVAHNVLRVRPNGNGALARIAAAALDALKERRRDNRPIDDDYLQTITHVCGSMWRVQGD